LVPPKIWGLSACSGLSVTIRIIRPSSSRVHHRIEVGRASCAVVSASSTGRAAADSDPRRVAAGCNRLLPSYTARRVHETRAVTPIFRPLDRRPTCRPPLAHATRGPETGRSRSRRCPSFGLRVKHVLIVAGHEIDRTGRAGIQRLRPAFESTIDTLQHRKPVNRAAASASVTGR